MIFAWLITGLLVVVLGFLWCLAIYTTASLIYSFFAERSATVKQSAVWSGQHEEFSIKMEAIDADLEKFRKRMNLP